MRITIMLMVLFVAAPAAAQASFTEYVEGSGYHKALEVSNTGSAPVDLSACRIQMYFNGDTEAGQDFTLSGRLAPGEAHVFYHQESSRDYSPAFQSATRGAPSSQSAGFGWFNGNDAIVLTCNGQVADSLGERGDDANWGKDVTLRRSSGPPKTEPDASWDPEAGGWTSRPSNKFDGLGEP